MIIILIIIPIINEIIQTNLYPILYKLHSFYPLHQLLPTEIWFTIYWIEYTMHLHHLPSMAEWKFFRENYIFYWHKLSI